MHQQFEDWVRDASQPSCVRKWADQLVGLGASWESFQREHDDIVKDLVDGGGIPLLAAHDVVKVAKKEHARRHAPMAVFWDLDTMPIPAARCGEDIAHKLRSALSSHGDLVQFRAYTSNSSAVDRETRLGLHRSGCRLIECDTQAMRTREMTIQMITVDSMQFAFANQERATLCFVVDVTDCLSYLQEALERPQWKTMFVTSGTKHLICTAQEGLSWETDVVGIELGTKAAIYEEEEGRGAAPVAEPKTGSTKDSNASFPQAADGGRVHLTRDRSDCSDDLRSGCSKDPSSGATLGCSSSSASVLSSGQDKHKIQDQLPGWRNFEEKSDLTLQETADASSIISKDDGGDIIITVEPTAIPASTRKNPELDDFAPLHELLKANGSGPQSAALKSTIGGLLRTTSPEKFRSRAMIKTFLARSIETGAVVESGEGGHKMLSLPVSDSRQHTPSPQKSEGEIVLKLGHDSIVLPGAHTPAFTNVEPVAEDFDNNPVNASVALGRELSALEAVATRRDQTKGNDGSTTSSIYATPGNSSIDDEPLVDERTISSVEWPEAETEISAATHLMQASSEGTDHPKTAVGNPSQMRTITSAAQWEEDVSLLRKLLHENANGASFSVRKSLIGIALKAANPVRFSSRPMLQSFLAKSIEAGVVVEAGIGPYKTLSMPESWDSATQHESSVLPLMVSQDIPTEILEVMPERLLEMSQHVPYILCAPKKLFPPGTQMPNRAFVQHAKDWLFLMFKSLPDARRTVINELPQLAKCVFVDWREHTVKVATDGSCLPTKDFGCEEERGDACCCHGGGRPNECDANALPSELPLVAGQNEACSEFCPWSSEAEKQKAVDRVVSLMKMMARNDDVYTKVGPLKKQLQRRYAMECITERDADTWVAAAIQSKKVVEFVRKDVDGPSLCLVENLHYASEEFPPRNFDTSKEEKHIEGLLWDAKSWVSRRDVIESLIVNFPSMQTPFRRTKVLMNGYRNNKIFLAKGPFGQL